MLLARGTWARYWPQPLDDDAGLRGTSSSSRCGQCRAQAPLTSRRFALRGCRTLACRSFISIAQFVDFCAYERTEASVVLRMRGTEASPWINDLDVFHARILNSTALAQGQLAAGLYLFFSTFLYQMSSLLYHSNSHSHTIIAVLASPTV